MKNVFSFTIVLILTLFFQTSATATTTLSPHNFIATAKNDTSIQAHKQMKFYLENAPADTPYLDRIELRAGLGDLDQKEQTYQLRFYPRAWGETRYSRELTQTVAQADELDQALHLLKALKKRYQLVIEYIQAIELSKTYKSMEVVYIDRINVLQQKSATVIDSNISGLITAEDKLTKLRLDLLDLNNRINNLKLTINRLAGGKFDIDFDAKAVIHIKTIALLIKNIQPESENGNVYLERQKHNIKLAQSRLDLEKAQSRDYISFFQISHSVDDDKENWEEKTSVEIGIKLPFINTDREAIWRRKAIQKREEYAYNQEKAITLEDSIQLLQKLKNSLSQHALLEEKKQKGVAAKTLEKHVTMEGVDPLDLLELKESILENEIRLSRLSFLVYSDFIELMEIMGRLTRDPLTDYLSNTLEQII